MSDEERKNLQARFSNVPTQVQLGATASLDISWLSESERKDLLLEYTKGMLDIGKKASELNVEAAVLKRTLDDLTDVALQGSDANRAVTLSHIHNSSVGRTEVIMGNTSAAKRGRLPASQNVQTNWTPVYVLSGIAAIVLIALFQ